MPWLKRSACGWWQAKRGPYSCCDARHVRPPTNPRQHLVRRPRSPFLFPKLSCGKGGLHESSLHQLERLLWPMPYAQHGSETVVPRLPAPHDFLLHHCPMPVAPPREFLPASMLPPLARPRSQPRQLLWRSNPLLEQLNETSPAKWKNSLRKPTPQLEVQAPIRQSDGNQSGGHQGCIGRSASTALAKQKRCIKARDVATEHLKTCEQKSQASPGTTPAGTGSCPGGRRRGHQSQNTGGARTAG